MANAKLIIVILFQISVPDQGYLAWCDANICPLHPGSGEASHVGQKDNSIEQLIEFPVVNLKRLVTSWSTKGKIDALGFNWQCVGATEDTRRMAKPIEFVEVTIIEKHRSGREGSGNELSGQDTNRDMEKCNWPTSSSCVKSQSRSSRHPGRFD